METHTITGRTFDLLECYVKLFNGSLMRMSVVDTSLRYGVYLGGVMFIVKYRPHLEASIITS